MCEACAAKETGMDHSFVSLTDTSFLANLLASVLGKHQETDDEENLKKTNLVCPSCHMTYNEFLKYGTLSLIHIWLALNSYDKIMIKTELSRQKTGSVSLLLTEACFND